MIARLRKLMSCLCWAMATSALGRRLLLTNSTSQATSTQPASVTAASSAAAKDNINTIPNALDLVEQLRGVTFKWKESGKKAVGLIYEEVKEVIPELTSEKEGHVGVAYQNTVALLIEAVKTLSAKVKQLESK
jgi:hypothetical protein